MKTSSIAKLGHHVDYILIFVTSIIVKVRILDVANPVPRSGSGTHRWSLRLI